MLQSACMNWVFSNIQMFKFKRDPKIYENYIVILFVILAFLLPFFFFYLKKLV